MAYLLASVTASAPPLRFPFADTTFCYNCNLEEEGMMLGYHYLAVLAWQQYFNESHNRQEPPRQR